MRRQPEEARTLILNAAEAVMPPEGPPGLRLQDVARKAGVSHPTILHHFGNREGLVRALNQRSLETLRSGLATAMTTASTSEDGIALTFAAYRNGLAQRTLWMLQADAPSAAPSMVEQVAEMLQAVRLQFAQPGDTVDMADSRAVAHLTAIAALGDALIGPRLRQCKAGEETVAREAFERWFARLISLFLRATH